MVAPNGGRLTKADHPKIPITMEEIVATAVECYAAGADGLHFHVRDQNGQHVLDVGQYRETLTELRHAVPNMFCQITTEAMGRYSPQQQRQLVDSVQPAAVSVSLAEMLRDGETKATTMFYAQCKERDIAVQHILYNRQDLDTLSHWVEAGNLSPDGLQILYVLGRYATPQNSFITDLDPLLAWLPRQRFLPDWAVCAFGHNETSCLLAAARHGGKVRIGFENSLFNANGTTARSNRERIVDYLAKSNF